MVAALERNEAGAESGLRARTAAILNRRPAVGLVAGVVRDGRLVFVHAHGLADIAGNVPASAGTVFRAGSVTKPFTAVAVLQLHEQGRIDLDAAAGDYLRAYRLVRARPGLRRPTVRHLLTHTGGIPEVRRVADLFHPGAGPIAGRPPIASVPYGLPLPTLAEHLRDGLPVVAQPGAEFAYSNLGFATLGQIVEDVSGMPLERYFRERIFEPLGMGDTGLVRTARPATGYVVGRRGAEAVPDRDWIGAGCGGLYSTVPDLARFAAALAGDGAGEHGRMLAPATLAEMFAPQFRPDPRLPGWGLGIARAVSGGRLLTGHDGILPGFNATLWLEPRRGLAVVAITNGSPGAFGWLGPEFRGLLGAPDDPVRADLPQHPEIWGSLCGVYRFTPRISDLRGRLAVPGGAQVFVRGGRLTIRGRTPVPALYRGAPLHPDDRDDPYVFRLDLPAGTARVVFGRDPAGDVVALHADLGGQPLTLTRRGRPGGTP